MSRRKNNRGALRSGDVDYLNGLLAAFDDFSDGAWGVACQNAIEADPRFSGRDAYDVWLAWVEAGAKPAKGV